MSRHHHHRGNGAPQQAVLNKFNMTKTAFPLNEPKGPVIILIGQRGTGKSFLVEDLMSHHVDVPTGIIISGTEMGNHFYAPHAPPAFIYHEYETKLIEGLLRRQQHVLQPANKHEAPDPRAFLLLDDCMYDESWSREKVMRCIFMNGRHWKIMCVITMQYPLGVPPVMRSNIDFVFLLYAATDKVRRILYENYASVFPDYDTFRVFFDATTQHHECMVVCPGALSNKLTDMVFWYKGEKRAPNYRLMAPAAWRESARIMAAAGAGAPGGGGGDLTGKKRKLNINVVKNH